MYISSDADSGVTKELHGSVMPCGIPGFYRWMGICRIFW